MTRIKFYFFPLLAAALSFGILFPRMIFASEFKVLTVMSYEEDFPWCKNIKEGIESVMGDACDVSYFYMDTKKNIEDGNEKAGEAFALYQTLRPDGVIAADDNAQSMFVVPYLKDKVKTPVMFCGVNAEPQKYGYPSSNVSGILERPHFGESLAFVRQLVPSIRTFGFIIKESPTGNAHLNQIQRESEGYPAKLTAFMMPQKAAEIAEMTNVIRDKSDALFVASLAGVPDKTGSPLSEKDAVKIALKTFGNKATIGTEEYTVRFGALCAVVRTGEEQGETAAKMLFKAMRGTPISQIPITQNSRGKRIINVTAMTALGIKPEPKILRGAELVKTE